MTPNEQKGVGAGTVLVLPAVVAWALVAVGVVVRRPALDTCRPAIRAFLQQPAVGDEALPARLWQDPLRTAYGAYESLGAGKRAERSQEDGRGAVARSAERTPQSLFSVNPPLTLQMLRVRIAERLVRGERVFVLPVLVSGEAYAEDAETRHRTRYAVLAGLSVTGHIPSDRNHIGYFTIDGPGAGASNERKFIVAFEWYEKNAPTEWAPRDPARHVLVLWVDEDQLGPKPLETLGGIVRPLGAELSWLANASALLCCRPNWWTLAKALALCVVDQNPSVKVIGPTRSDVLVAMLSSVKRGLPGALTGVRFYCSRATICEELLGEALGEDASTRRVQDLFQRLNLRRTIADDEQVCEQLVHELKLRYVASSKSDVHVALVAEWDTAYGRALPETFARAYERGGGPDGSRENVRFFAYLQGIDGLLPGEEQALDQVVSREARESVAAMERPEGKAQLDHIRRLEWQLARYNHKLKRDRKGCLRAIGILGSDVYDKLLILRALRPSFPGVIFFTTDLDARLLHPDEQKWARNLIVGSSFGLQLSDDLQGRIPPFRGSYQTSDFFATLSTLEHQRIRVGARGRPQVYEIGRSGQYGLSLDAHPWPHPPSSRQQPWLSWRRFLWILLALGCLSLLLLLLLIRFTNRGCAQLGAC